MTKCRGLERLKKYCSHAERGFLVPGRGSAFGEALAKEHGCKRPSHELPLWAGGRGLLLWDVGNDHVAELPGQTRQGPSFGFQDLLFVFGQALLDVAGSMHHQTPEPSRQFSS